MAVTFLPSSEMLEMVAVSSICRRYTRYNILHPNNFFFFFIVSFFKLIVHVINLFLQTGSASSISSSQISLDDTVREENNASPSSINRLTRENSFDFKLDNGTPLSAKDIKRLESREDEWKKRLQKKEADFFKIMEKKEEELRVKMLEKEKEWKKIVEKHEKEKNKLVEEKLKAESDKTAMESALNSAEGIVT